MNNVETLPLAIASVFAQTFCDWELLLMDDGSKDGSLEVAKSVKDPRVHVVSDGQNKGLPSRLNEIAALANGELLVRMDADDLMHPERLARQVAFLDKYPDVDVVGTGAYSVDSSYRVIGIRNLGELDTRPISVLKHSLFAHPTVMGRTEWFTANRYDPSYDRAEDHELWCRTFRTSRFAVIREPLYFYREVGVFSLRNYLRSGCTDRKILRRYGPSLVGATATAVLIGRSYAKSALYWTLTLVRAEDLLVRRRSYRLSETEAAKAQELVRKIIDTAVPGLSVAGNHQVCC